MLNFEEEIKTYAPIPEISDVEELVKNKDLTDMTDIMKMMLADKKEEEGR